MQKITSSLLTLGVLSFWIETNIHKDAEGKSGEGKSELRNGYGRKKLLLNGNCNRNMEGIYYHDGLVAVDKGLAISLSVVSSV